MTKPEPRLHHATDDPGPVLAGGVPPKEAPSLATIVANTVATTPLALRARLLRRLLMPIGPLPLTVLTGGAFAKYVEFARCHAFRCRSKTRRV